MYYLIDKKTGSKICRTKHRKDVVEIIENTIYEDYDYYFSDGALV